MSDETNDIAYRKKVLVIREAAKKVESILGVHFVQSNYMDYIAFYRSKADYDGLTHYAMEERESRRLGIGIHFNENGGTYYPDAAQEVSGDDPWACEPAPWKAAVLEELRALVRLTAEEAKYFDYAAGAFRGDFIHPLVTNDLR